MIGWYSDNGLLEKQKLPVGFDNIIIPPSLHDGFIYYNFLFDVVIIYSSVAHVVIVLFCTKNGGESPFPSRPPNIIFLNILSVIEMSGYLCAGIT